MLRVMLLLIVILMCGGSLTAQEDTKKQELTPDQIKFEVNKNFSTGYEYWKNKMYKESIPPLKKVVELEPTKASAWRYLTYSYQNIMQKYTREGNSELSAAYLDSTMNTYYKALEVFPESEYFYQMMAYVYKLTGNLDSARVCNETIVDLHKAGKVKKKQTTVNAMMNLGELSYKDEEYEDALDWYSQASELDPNDDKILKIISDISKQIGASDVLIEKLEQQVQLNPQDDKAWVKLINAYLKDEYYENASNSSDSLLKLTPENPENLFLAATAYQKVENFSKAITTYKKLIDIKPKHNKALAELAMCYAEQNQISSAKVYVCRSIRVDRSYARAQWVKGEIIQRIAAGKRDEEGLITYEGKYFYEYAVQQFQKIVNDPVLGSKAAQRIQFLKQMTPTKEDKFMHQSEEKPQLNFGC